MNIDWSKSPYDATHYHPCADGYVEHWIKPGFFCKTGFESGGWKEDISDALRLAVPRPVKAPAEWNGEGLPPVGAVCELVCDGVDQGVVTVMYISDEFCVCKSHKYDHEQGARTDRYKFKPFRTPEQIAADERMHEIRNALTAINSKVHFPTDLVRGNILAAAVEAMIDAGYRKQVKP